MTIAMAATRLTSIKRAGVASSRCDAHRCFLYTCQVRRQPSNTMTERELLPPRMTAAMILVITSAVA
jgi:hypothetical protein